MGAVSKTVGKLFGIKAPVIQAPPPSPMDDPAAKAAAAEAADRERRVRSLSTGRASTMMFGGIGETVAPTTAAKKLLGE